MEDRELTPEQRAAKETFVENRGYWPHRESGTPHLRHILELDPAYLATYSEYSSHPEAVLGPKLKQFIHVAIDILTTRHYISHGDPGTGESHLGAREHIRFAFEYGATLEELVEVVELTVSGGIYSTLLEGASLLDEEAEATGTADDADLEELRAAFEDTFGYWSEDWDDVLRQDPEHFEHVVDLFGHPYEEGPLDRKEKELINVANAVTSSHLYSRGARMYIRAALEAGATRDEVMATVQTASVVGMHTAIETMPVLVEEARERGLLDDGEGSEPSV